MLSTYSGGDLWLRRWSFALIGDKGNVLELTAGQGGSGLQTVDRNGRPIAEGLRMKFRTVAADMGIPNHAEITVYNCSDQTAKKIQNHEYSRVLLQAGYVNGKFGVIFDGTIKMTKRGHENATDSYITIYAADGDLALNQTTVDPIYMQRKSDGEQRTTAIRDNLQQKGVVSAGPVEGLGKAGVLERGKILWGRANALLDTTSRQFGQWSIQNGALQFRPKNGYLPGEAVVLNAHSGLVGVPENNEQGVFATALLNPSVKVGGLAKINNADINTSEPAIATTQLAPGQFGYPGFTDINFFASTDADGVYVVLLIEYEGDTRENAWYMHLGMLLQDVATGTAAPPSSPR